MDSEIKMTMEQARKQMEIFRQLFHEVRLLNASDLGVEAGDSGEPNIWKTSCECRSCLGQKSFEEACIARKVLKEKGQKTKYENAGTELKEIIAKYVEVDDTPYVMEYVRRVDTDAVLGEVTTESAKTNMTEFYKMLYTDALSQAYNRRYFEDRIRKKVVTAGIAMIDLDDFKTSNDTYGHECGDEVLRTLAAVFKKEMEGHGVVARWGGEEFLILYYGENKEDFYMLLEYIRMKIYEAQFLYDRNRLSVSVTIGMAAFAKDMSLDEIINNADMKLYEGKKSGKNKVM